MPERDKSGRFAAGNSGGPGRAIGSRAKLSEEFWDDFRRDWAENGVQAIVRLREERVDKYVAIARSASPTQLQVERVSPFDGVSDEELREIERHIAEQRLRTVRQLKQIDATAVMIEHEPEPQPTPVPLPDDAPTDTSGERDRG